MCSQDPVVCQAKLVAEPWDVGQMDGNDLGRFPALWREWNGKYRDTMRVFWRSHPVGIGEFADRFAGSSDLYSTAGRRPTSSVNLITVHDGFTLRNLVSYNDKHNEANGEHKPRRDQRQQFLELRRRRPRRRPRCAGAARPPVQGPCPPYLMPHASSRHVGSRAGAGQAAAPPVGGPAAPPSPPRSKSAHPALWGCPDEDVR